MAAGKAIFTDNCERCHGDMGKGDGPDGDLYDPGPTDFTDVEVDAVGMIDGELFLQNYGKAAGPCPALKVAHRPTALASDELLTHLL